MNIVNIFVLSLCVGVFSASCSKKSSKNDSKPAAEPNVTSQEKKEPSLPPVQAPEDESLTFEKIRKHLDDAQTVKDKETVLYMVRLFTNKALFAKMNRLCADQSSKIDLNECLKAAQEEILDMRLVLGSQK